MFFVLQKVQLILLYRTFFTQIIFYHLITDQLMKDAQQKKGLSAAQMFLPITI